MCRPSAEGSVPVLDESDTIRYIAELLPSLVNMAETSNRPLLAYLLDMARREAAETLGVKPASVDEFQ